MKITIALAASLLLAGTALADVAPEPPVNPIPETCKPLIGVWQRAEPERNRFMATWTFLLIDSSLATVVYYMDEGKGVNIQTQTARFYMSCTPADGGVLKLAFSTATDEEGEWAMDVVLAGDSFTSQAETTYDSPGPPPADWKPESYTVTWKRIAP